MDGQSIAVIRDATPLAPVTYTDAVIHMIDRAARDPSVDLDKLERLMAMRERMGARAAEQAFDVAMAACQSEMAPVATDSNNPSTHSKYASYAALDRALRSIYTRNGFALSFDTVPGAAELSVRVACHVSHNGGHSRDYHIDMPADGKGARGNDVMTRTHATGSAVSYGTRYLLKMIFNVAVGEADDDGNAAGQRDNGKVTTVQVEHLQKLIVQVAADIPKFCAYFKIGSIADLPSSQFNRAVDALNSKKAKS